MGALIYTSDMEHIVNFFSNKWVVISIITLLSGGNVSQFLYTGHNPEALPVHTESPQVIPKVIIRRVPDKTIERICREANHDHEREYHNVR